MLYMEEVGMWTALIATLTFLIGWVAGLALERLRRAEEREEWKNRVRYLENSMLYWRRIATRGGRR